MKWKNLILYSGVVCVLVGIILTILAETNRTYFIAGATISWGLIISIPGWIFYQWKEPFSDRSV